MSSENVAHLNIPQLYMICPMCKEKYDTSEKFVDHAIEKHMEWKPFRCEECLPFSATIFFPTETRLREHQLNIHKVAQGKYTFHDDSGKQKLLELLTKKAIAEGSQDFDKIAPKIPLENGITLSNGKDPMDPRPGANELITDSGRKHFPNVIAFNNRFEQDVNTTGERVQPEVQNAPPEIVRQNEAPPPDMDEQPVAEAPRNSSNDQEDTETGNAPNIIAFPPAEAPMNHRPLRQPFVNMPARQMEQVFNRLRNEQQPQVVRPLAWMFRGGRNGINRNRLLQPTDNQRMEIRRNHERRRIEVVNRQRRAIDEIYGIYDENRRRQHERLNNQPADTPRRRPLIRPFPPLLHNEANQGPRYVPAAFPRLPNVAIDDSDDSDSDWSVEEDEVNLRSVVEIGADSEYEDESEDEPPRRRARMDLSRVIQGWVNMRRNNRGDNDAPAVNP